MFYELPKALGILVAEQESYTYVDKFGYAPSKDLAIFYLKEALRDLSSLSKKDKFENPRAKEALNQVNFEKIEKEIDALYEVKDRSELREITSIIASKALVISARLEATGSASGGV